LRLFGADRLQAVGAALRLALDAVVAGACLAIERALMIDMLAQSRDLLREPVEHRQFGKLGFGHAEARPGLGEACFDAALGLI
jgi:hypothetical protein